MVIQHHRVFILQKQLAQIPQARKISTIHGNHRFIAPALYRIAWGDGENIRHKGQLIGQRAMQAKNCPFAHLLQPQAQRQPTAHGIPIRAHMANDEKVPAGF